MKALTEDMKKALTPSQETQARVARQDMEERKAAQEAAEKRAQQSPFTRFYQVNKANSHYLADLANENPKALAILLFIFENMDNYNAVCFSYKVIQERFQMGRTTASNCIKYLKDHGYVYVYKAGTTNVYVANDQLVWSTYGDRVRHCKFPANVILTSSEQEKADLVTQYTKTITEKAQKQ